MCLFKLPEIEAGIAKPHIREIILHRRVDIFLSLYVIPYRAVYQERIAQIVNIFPDCRSAYLLFLYSLFLLCGLVLGSNIYYKHTENEKKREYEEQLMKHIDALHTKYPCLGSRKLVNLLNGEHFCVGRKLVRRLMQVMGLYVIYPKPNLSKRDFRESIVPYLLKNKVVDFPNQVWSIDITYIPIGRGHMYLTAIIDWLSRKLMGWTLSDTLDTAPVLDTVKEVVGRYEVPAIINSDQGCQFTSGEYKNLLRQYGIRQSMDGKSRWADNIMIERWFRSLKTELIYINDYASPKELRGAIRDYVEEYNSIRPHQSLGYLTPDQVYGSSFGALA